MACTRGGRRIKEVAHLDKLWRGGRGWRGAGVQQEALRAVGSELEDDVDSRAAGHRGRPRPTVPREVTTQLLADGAAGALGTHTPGGTAGRKVVTEVRVATRACVADQSCNTHLASTFIPDSVVNVARK